MSYLTSPRLISILFLSVLLLSFTPGDSDSDSDFLRKIATYHSIYRQEKAYLHIDKPAYYTGETIWFSAYLINIKNNNLNQTEEVLYVDLIKPSGQIVQKNMFKLENGRSFGQIDVKAHFKTGEYFLVAYTNWMRNFGSEFYFKRPVLILNENIASSNEKTEDIDSIRQAFSGTNDMFEQDNRPELTLKFYPEGGDIVQNVAGKVAFEAKDNHGKTLSVNGFVKDDAGNVMATLQSMWRGKGYFIFTPEAGKTYYAEVEDSKNEVLRFDLPEVKQKGYTLSVESSPQAKNILVTVNKNPAKKPGQVFLLAMLNSTPMYALADSVFDKPRTYAVPKDRFSTGIIQFTLFDEAKRPQCERLFFLNKNEVLNLEIRGLDIAPEQREKVTLELLAKDKNGMPAQGTFSIAVTDADRIDDSFYADPDFVSDFYLGSNLPGVSYNLRELLQPGSKSHLKAELLMMTNGWRRYSWEKVLEDTISLPEYLEEPGIYVKGKLFKNNDKKKEVPEGLDVTMMLPKRFDAYTQLTDKNGEFSFLVQSFNDTMPAVIQTKNKMKLKRDYILEMETNFKSKPVDFIPPENLELYSENSSDEFTGYFKRLKQESLEEELKKSRTLDLYLDTTDVTIDEVTVTGIKRKDAKGSIVSKYGAPHQSVGKSQLDELNEEKSWNWGLISILQDAFPGLAIITQSDSAVRFFPQDRRRHRFFIFVDGELVGASDSNGQLTKMHRLYSVYDLISLDPEIVSSVDLIYPQDKNVGNDLIATAEFYDYEIQEDITQDLDRLIEQSENLNAPVAILSIYTTNGNGLLSRVHYKGLMKFKLTGYTSTKEFYMPDYSNETSNVTTDQRTTLYWNPMVKTDNEGKATIEFYNSDVAFNYRADVVGISSAGTPGDYRVKFGSGDTLKYETVPEIKRDSNDIIYYENPEDAPGYVDKKAEEPVWINPTKIKVHVTRPDGNPAVFATISAGKSWHNVTDETGNVYLDMALLREGDSVNVSFQGSAAKNMIVQEIFDADTSIQLKTLSIQASDLDASDLAKKVLRKVLSTRTNKSIYGISIYREQINWDDQLHALFDVNLVTRVPSIKDKSIEYGTRVLKGQWFKANNFDNNALYYPLVNSIFGIQNMDPAYSNATFLSLSYFKNYTYQLDGITKYQNRGVYKLSFDQKDDTPWSLQKGFILVDIHTLGIVYVEWGTSPKGLKFVLPDQYIMAGTKYDDFKLQQDINRASYVFDGEDWQLKAARQDVAFILNNTFCSYSREYFIQEYMTKLPFKFQPERLESLEKRFVLLKNPVYNPQKWRVPWFLPVNKNIKENMPYLPELLILADPEVEMDLMNIDF